MFEKGSIVKAVKPAQGITVGKEYLVQQFTYGQTEFYDRIAITNDAGVIHQTYFAHLFEKAEIPTPEK